MEKKVKIIVAGFLSELCLMVRRALEGWRLVPWMYRLSLGAAVLVMAVTSAANTAIPVALGRLVEAVNPAGRDRGSPDMLLRVAGGYLAFLGGCYLLREALNVLRRFLAENACTRINRELTVRAVGHVMKLDLSVLAQQQVGTLHGRIVRGVDGLVRFLRYGFLDFLPALLSGSFALMAALCREPRLALVMAGVIPVSVTLTIWQLITQKGVRLDLMRSCEAMDGTIVEQLGGLDYVRAANTHEQEVLRVANAAEKKRAKEIRHHFEMSLFGCGKAINEGFWHLVVLAYAITLFVHGRIHYGDILTFSVLYLNLMAPLNEIHRFIDEAHESSLRVGDLLTILGEPVDRSFQATGGPPPLVGVGEPVLVTENLRVDYATGDGKLRPALRGVSLTIRHGETIGVAGRSGCGKTTWLKVLLRLTHPSAGSARVAGTPLDAVTRETIGELIGYVGQNPFIFAGTVAENIAYGSREATREQIEQAARDACIHDEIMTMPGGYDSRVAERGQNLSGGQRQRLALARVFLKNPPVMILDEGTSALDNISERRIQQAIEAARADRTVILVAHRLTTLLDTDRIFVFDEGQVVETGSYDELVRRGGVFAELVRSASDPTATPSVLSPAGAAA